MPGILDAIGKMASPESVLKLLEGFLSPTQKMILTQLPKVVSETLDLSKMPAPKMSLVKKDNTVGVLYEFATPEQANKFYDNEMQLQTVLMTVLKEVKQASNETAKPTA